MDAREAVRCAWPAAHTPEFIASQRDYLEAAMERAPVNPTPLSARHRQMEAIQGWCSHSRLGAITAPTLILAGDRDVLVPPENSRILHERISGSRLAMIPEAAHSFATSHPEEAVRIVTEFLRSVETPATAAAEV